MARVAIKPPTAPADAAPAKSNDFLRKYWSTMAAPELRKALAALDAELRQVAEDFAAEAAINKKYSEKVLYVETELQQMQATYAKLINRVENNTRAKVTDRLTRNYEKQLEDLREQIVALEAAQPVPNARGHTHSCPECGCDIVPVPLKKKVLVRKIL